MTIKTPKIFLDSGNPEETKRAKALLGSLDGQTTNPSLVAKHPEAVKYLSQGKKLTEAELLNLYREIIQNIGKEIAGPISAEVYADWTTPASKMLEQAHEMAAWGRNIYIKFPIIPEGLKAAHEFVKKGGRVNMTLAFDQNQAAAVYMATLATGAEARGPHFVSPFLGRWDDRGFAGLDLLKNIIKMYKKFDKQKKIKKSHVEVLAASIRNLDHLYGSIFLGADILTIPFKIIEAWIQDEKRLPDTNYHLETQGLKSIIYEDLNLKPNFEDYKIEKIEGSLLFEGIKRFVNDWNSLLV